MGLTCSIYIMCDIKAHVHRAARPPGTPSRKAAAGRIMDICVLTLTNKMF